MKIVHIEDYFHPEAGYQINIVPKYMAQMGHEVTVITSEMDKIPEHLTSFFGRDNIEYYDRLYTEKYGVKIVRIPLKGFVSGRAIFCRSLFHTIREEKPDVVYIHGNDTLTGMRYLLKRKKMGYPLVMDSHMLEMASQNKLNKVFRWVYRHFFTPILIKENIPVIRTQNDPYVEKCLGIPLAQSPWISVGSDTMLFRPDALVKGQFRKENNIKQDSFVVIYAGKLDESKGGMLLAEAIERKLPVNKNVEFVIVGKTAGEYGRQVEEKFAKSENRILRFPTQKYGDLARFYQAADLAVFPRQCSLSFYDVQACGLPVVFEDNNINVDRCSHKNGLVFEAENVESFRDKMAQLICMEDRDYQTMGENSIALVRQTFDYAEITERYMRIIEEVANRN
jgi:glycosyltransferase involved in cell wall biosynthesis